MTLQISMTPPALVVRQLKILLVEDNEGDALLVEAFLNEASTSDFTLDARLTHAERLSQTLDILAETPFDLILLDLSLPDSYGLDTAQQVLEAAPKLPLIIMSGEDDQTLALEAVQAGAQDYLVKGHLDSHWLTRAIHYAIERKQTEQALRSYATELEEKNAELDAFAHMVAHDLRNPLGVMTGFSRLLQQSFEEISVGEVHQALQQITQTGRKMSRIIDELLLLASIRKKNEIEFTKLDTKFIVDEALSRLVDRIAEMQAEVIVPESWPAAVGYGPWVEEIWSNYISNALKYGGRPPRVELGADTCSEWVRFWVRDNGPGLTKEQQSQLFTQFTRLHQTRARGDGLGLSIVRRIINKLGGEAGVESIEGVGSLFYFTLPRAE